MGHIVDEWENELIALVLTAIYAALVQRGSKEDILHSKHCAKCGKAEIKSSSPCS